MLHWRRARVWVGTASYWLSGGGYSLAGLWRGKKEIFLPPAEVVEKASSYPELGSSWCPVGESSALWLFILNAISFICASLVAQRLKNPLAVQETQVHSLGQEDPLEKAMATHYSILPWRIHGTTRLAGYSPWGHKETRVSN